MCHVLWFYSIFSVGKGSSVLEVLTATTLAFLLQTTAEFPLSFVLLMYCVKAQHGLVLFQTGIEAKKKLKYDLCSLQHCSWPCSVHPNAAVANFSSLEMHYEAHRIFDFCHCLHMRLQIKMISTLHQ